MDKCLCSVKERLKREAYHLDSVQLVRALDRVSGKLKAMDQLLPSTDLSMYVKLSLTLCYG
jgi:septation ring formation regulator EzrA